MAGAWAVNDVSVRTSIRIFTPRAWAAFTEVAMMLHSTHQFPDAKQLVDGVMDRRVDWLT